MPEMRVCVGCGALVPLDRFEKSRCQTCADNLRARENRRPRTRSPEQEAKRREASRFYRTSRWRKVRRAVLTRDRYTCHWCGRADATEADHIIPRSVDRARELDTTNLVASCKRCNVQRGGKLTRRR